MLPILPSFNLLDSLDWIWFTQDKQNIVILSYYHQIAVCTEKKLSDRNTKWLKSFSVQKSFQMIENLSRKPISTEITISPMWFAKISILLNPIIPTSSSKVLDSMNIDSKFRNLSFLDGKDILPKNVKIKDLKILFKKIT